MRTYAVLIRHHALADLRIFQIVAESLQDASELAEKVVAGLSSEVIGSIKVDGGGQGGGDEILDVYDAYDDPALWLCSRDELLSSNLEALFANVAPVQSTRADEVKLRGELPRRWCVLRGRGSRIPSTGTLQKVISTSDREGAGRLPGQHIPA